jgi:dynein heavy chain
LGLCIAALKSSKKEKWITEWAGQLLVTTSLVHWTSDGERMLADYEKGTKGTMRVTRKKWHSTLAKFIEMVPSPLSQVERSKLTALIVTNVHCRDVFDRLAKAGVSSPNHFDWVSQLRFVWDKDSENCSVLQDRCTLTYGGDYIGNGPRLVITPLTDRVYLTLTTAMSNFLGGSPQGPAGTGKTETVRDLARSLAKVFSVINCSEQFDSVAMCRVLLGTCTQGGWTCFDEINRVRVDVLSVFAQQVITVLSGLRDGSKTIRLDGQQILFRPQVGLFSTMIPDLTKPDAIPDSLSVLFRPVAMTLPDVASIAEVTLYSFGFMEAKALGRKIVLVLQIMANQMTRQSHYDKSLRAVKVILDTAGFLMSKKESHASEESVVVASVCQCTEPKLVAEDREIFKGIIEDVFPLEEVPLQEDNELQTLVQESIACVMPDRYKGRFRESSEHELFISKAAASNELLVKKIMQMNKLKKHRGSFILIGDASSGKTTSLSALAKALNQMAKESTGGVHPSVRIQKYFVKVFTVSELYGFADTTGVWQDGLLSRCIRSASNDDHSDEKWIVLDGTNDATWMESLNSVLDNSKLMSLPSGERISVPDNVRFVFESLNLAAATPATVSRAGILYMDAAHLTWHAWFLRWLDARPRNELRDALQTTFERVVPNIISVTMNVGVFPIPYSESALVRSLCSLLESFLIPENGVVGEFKDAASLAEAVKLQDMWLLFCIAWSFGGAIGEEGRIRVDMLVRELDSGIPSKLTVFDLWVDPKKVSWVSWEDRLTSFRPPAGTPFKNMIVSTPETVRLNYIVSHLCKMGHSSFVIGPSGTGKSAILRNMLSSNSENFLSKYILLSHSTSSQSLEDHVFSGLEKRSKDVWGPALSKKMVAFVDDVNLPAADVHGTQPALEAFRQLLDVSVLYDRQRLVPLQIQDITYVCAATLSTDLKQFPRRLASLVPIINSGSVKDASLKRIFTSLVAAKLTDFDDGVRSSVDAIANALIDINRNVATSLVPNPSKSHYVFSLQDVVKVAEGFSVLQPSAIDSKDLSLKFFCSEVVRVYAGRLIDLQDRGVLKKILDEAAQAHMDCNLRGIFTSSKGEVVPFVNFLRSVEDHKGPEESSFADMKACLDKKFLDYLSSTGATPFTMVFFKEAIANIVTIAHVLKLPRATSMQVGLGSSGRTTLTKFASFMLGYDFQTLEIRKDMNLIDFRDNMKALIMNAVMKKQHTTFLFKDEHIIDDSFFETVYSFITSAEIAGLLNTDDWRAVTALFSAEPNGPSIQTQFWAAAGEYVHVVLCFSPIGNTLRARMRQFPCLLGCCSVSWLLDWQQESLKEISAKITENVRFDTPALQSAFVNSISGMHEVAVSMATRSFKETGRLNFVTPGHFLEFTSTFAAVFSEKKSFFENSIFKFENGLKKLDQAKQEVEDVSVVLAKKKIEVEAAQKECEELLLVIVHEKRVCEDQEAHISAQAEKIKGETETCITIAAAAQADLEKAMPALQNALKALDALNKSDISEIKMYAKPPDLVMLTLSAVLVLRRASSLEWSEAQKHLGDPSFLKQLVDYEKDTLLNDAMLKKLEKYIENPQFDPEKVGKVSKAAMSLCLWSRAMYSYGLVNKAVVPKKEKAAAAMATLEKKQAALAESQDGLRKVQEKLAALKEKYDSSVGVKEKLKSDCDALEARSAKALNLIQGLGAERLRWQETIVVLKESLLNSLGNSVISAGFLAYAGPLSEVYRKELLDDLFVQNIVKSKVRVSPGLDIPLFLVPAASIRDWNVCGLSSDAFSIQNAVLVQKYVRWPLIIDPQSQAVKWLSNMHKGRLTVVDPKIDGWMRVLENCIQLGNIAFLLITDHVDPALHHLLSKAIVNQDGVFMLKCFGKQLVYHNNFELILSSRLPNPSFSAALCTQTSIVNFCIKDQGLEEQLLSLIVKKERYDLEEQKQHLISKTAQGKNQLEELQESILKMLSTLEGSLLDNDTIVGVLHDSKSTAESISEQLAISEATEQEIDEARQQYHPIAARCALLFLVVNDLCMVDHMYQFSLESYCDLILRSLDKSHKTEVLSDRVNAVNEWHTYSTFRFACRALFEKDKPVLALKLCAKILESQKRLNRAEWQFFLRGGFVTNREAQPPRPVDWLTVSAWDNITELEKLPAFRDIVSAFEQSSSDWFEWYSSKIPEDTVLPGEWASKLNELQRLVLVRCVRPDRVGTASMKIVVSNMGAKYVDTVPTDIATAYLESSPIIPLIFILADGVDPLSQLQSHADKCSASGTLKVELKVLALGHGQEVSAERIIAEGAKSGHWVYLRNCHLMPDWMPNLERIFNNLCTSKPHKNFRLWLSSKSNKNFPTGVLQPGVKIVLEQQSSVRAIMGQHYSRFSVDTFAKCSKPSQYKKLLFSLSFLHATVVQRQRYGSCGWKRIYNFSDSDFDMSERILQLQLSEEGEVPWSALHTLIADVTYGNRVSDELDLKLLRVLVKQCLSSSSITVDSYKLSDNEIYTVPQDGMFPSYLDHIRSLPSVDSSEVFGLNQNSDTEYMARTSLYLICTLDSMSTKRAGGDDEKVNERLSTLVNQLLSMLPAKFNVQAVRSSKEGSDQERSPLDNFLIRELECFNRLLTVIRQMLEALRLGLQGLALMTSDLDQALALLDAGKVPPSWGSFYLSMKSLGPWMTDLQLRIEAVKNWAEGASPPKAFWMGGFCDPIAFAAAVQQTAVRKLGAPYDALIWEFVIINSVESDIKVTSAGILNCIFSINIGNSLCVTGRSERRSFRQRPHA